MPRFAASRLAASAVLLAMLTDFGHLAENLLILVRAEVLFGPRLRLFVRERPDRFPGTKAVVGALSIG